MMELLEENIEMCIGKNFLTNIPTAQGISPRNNKVN